MAPPGPATRQCLRSARRPDLRRTYRLGHTEEDRDALAAAAGRELLGRHAEAAVEVLPVVHDPHVARRPDREIGLHLEAPAHVAAGRRDLVAGLHAGRAVLGTHAAQLRDRAVRAGEVGDPDVVVAVDGRRPGAGKATPLNGEPGYSLPSGRSSGTL